MQLLQRRFGVEVREEVRMQPLRQLLHGDEAVGAVVELVPDRVDLAVRHRLDAGEAGAFHQRGQLGPRRLRVRSGADAHPGPAGHVGLPVAAGHDDLVRVRGDDLLGVDRAEGAGDEGGRHVVAPRQLHEGAEVAVAEGHAAILRVAAGAFDEDQRPVEVGLRRDHVGDAGDLVLVEGVELRRALLLAEDLADDLHRPRGVLERLLAEVDVDDGDADLGQLLLVAGLVRGGLRLEVQDHHVGVERHGLFDVEGAVLEPAEGGDIGDLVKLLGVERVAFRRGLQQVVAPADHPPEGILAVQHGSKEDLAPFAQDDAVGGAVQRDLPPGDVGQGDGLGQREGGQKRQRGRAKQASKGHVRVLVAGHALGLNLSD